MGRSELVFANTSQMGKIKKASYDDEIPEK